MATSDSQAVYPFTPRQPGRVHGHLELDVGLHYQNPILPGFFPDPSVVCVGRDYYLVNSTFHYFPAIIISHSRDLVSWRQIGHVFTDPETLDLRHYFDGCGIWAPDISFHNGEFFVFYCLVQLTKDRTINLRGNYMVRSKSIHGPWSRPVQLTAEGNDPSHFVDDDGTHYMLFAAGLPIGYGTKIARLTPDCTELAGPPVWMTWGPERRAPEGPHLFKRDGYYYHTMASQGGYTPTHHQIIARSRHILGPYEPSPYNPFIAQKSHKADEKNHGHAKVFSTADGDWWATYLVQRPIDGFSVLGRETSLDRVHWLKDDWPVLNHGRGPSDSAAEVTSAMAAPESCRPEDAAVDDFTSQVLDPAWLFVRDPTPANPIVGKRPSHLRLHATTAAEPLLEPRSLLLRRETSHRFTAETKLVIPSVSTSPQSRGGAELTEGLTHGSNQGQAGLACYYDSSSNITLSVTVGSPTVLELRQCRLGNTTTVARRNLPQVDQVWLRVRVNRLERAFSYSQNGIEWTEFATIADCSFLSDEGTANWGFLGTLTGLFVLPGQEVGTSVHADFDYFRLTGDSNRI